MMQDTGSDTFDVEVEWADDGLGNEVVKHYTVQCVDAGADTCDTGPLIAPGPNQAPRPTRSGRRLRPSRSPTTSTSCRTSR